MKWRRRCQADILETQFGQLEMNGKKNQGGIIRMKKRIIASILTCAMAASLFIGCGSAGGNTKEGAAVEEAPAAEEGGEESAAPQLLMKS